MSKTTSSPFPISRSPGSACGSARSGPRRRSAGTTAPPRALYACDGRARDVELGAPRHPLLDGPAVDVVGEFGGGLDRLQLGGVLTARSNSTRSPRSELGVRAGVGDRVGELGQLADAHLAVLEADLAVQPPDDLGDHLALGLGPVPALPHLVGSAFGVAEVGEEHPVFRADQARAVRPGEAGEVTTFTRSVTRIWSSPTSPTSSASLAPRSEASVGSLISFGLRDAQVLRDDLERLAVPLGLLAVDPADHRVEAVEDGDPPELLAL